MVMMMLMAVFVPVFMVVVFAAIRGNGQPAAQISRHQFFHGCPGLSGAHDDLMNWDGDFHK